MAEERLPIKPFADWLNREIAKTSSVEVARRIGSEERYVYRWRNCLASGSRDGVKGDYPTETILRSSVEDALHHAGVFLWEVYDEDDDPGEVYTGRRRGKPYGVYGKLTDDELRALNRLHLEGGLSIRELGRRIWERKGYASAASAGSSISYGFRRMGLASRDRVEATVKVSLKHGKARRGQARTEYRKELRRKTGELLDRPRCAGKKLNPPRAGEPCQLVALADSKFCFQHDPRFDVSRRKQLKAMRARVGGKD
jgi:hypothetical protein